MQADVDLPPSDSTTLDVRAVPIWRRLPLIVGAVGSLEPGAALELVVDLDPWPLRSFIDSAVLDWQYLESGPSVWRVRLSRRA